MVDYFVSVDGANSNSGNSPRAPLRGIQKGINKLKAGDTLHIMNGTYLPGDENLDFWRVSDLHGTPAKEITIQAYKGHSPVLSGAESGAGNGFPQTGLKANSKAIVWRGTTYKHTLSALVEMKDCSYLTLDGLRLEKSLGHIIRVIGSVQNKYTSEFAGSANEGPKAAVAHHLTFTNCTLHNSRQRNMFVRNVWHITINNCEMSFGSWALRGGSGGPQFQNSYYVFFDDNYVHHQCGETIVLRDNNTSCKKVYIRNNIWWDNEDGIYVTGESYIIISGNFIYRSPQEDDAKKGISDNDVGGIVIRTPECDQDLQYGIDHGISYVLVNNNILVNLDTGIKLKVDPPENSAGGENPTTCNGYQPKPMEYIYITNNTVVNSCNINFLFATSTAANCVFKNNVSLNSAAVKHVKSGYATNAQLAGWAAGYNLYGGSDPSGHIPARLKGSHDLYDRDPQLLDASPPQKGRPVERPNQAGHWVNFERAPGFDNANGFRIAAGSPAKKAGASILAPVGWNSDSYDDAMSDWIDGEYDFARRRTKNTRTGSWDIGAHGYGLDGGAAPPSITAVTVERETTYNAVLNEPLAFAAAAAGGTGALSFLWDFGDGKTAVTQSPDHTFSAAGHYIVRLTVTDSRGLSAADSVLVDVKPDLSSGGTPVVVEQVLVSAGTPSYAVNGKPQAIFMMMTAANAGDTPVDGTLLSAGVWSGDGRQLAAALYARHGSGTSLTRSLNVNDGVLHYLDESEDWSNVVTVDSVSSTTVNLSWPAVQNGERVLTWNFYGDDVTNITAREVALGAQNSVVKIAGDYNRLIMPASLTAGVNATWRGVFSLAVAVRDGNTICHTYQNRNNRTAAEILSATSTDRVAYCPSRGTYVAIESWDAGGITFRVIGGDVNGFVPALLMKVNGAQWEAGVVDTPTAVGSSPFTDPGIEGQLLWMFGCLGTRYDADDIIDDGAGVFNFHSVDESGHEYSLAISSDRDDGGSDESSYFAEHWNQRGANGSRVANGRLSLIANGFSWNVTNAGPKAYKNAYVLFEKTRAPTLLAANFAYLKAGTNPADNEPIFAGELIQFRDLTASDHAIISWEWDWGDSTGHGSTQNPTHSFTAAGRYAVQLNVVGANGGSDSIIIDVPVEIPAPTIDFDIDGDIMPNAGTGTAPLLCTIDGRGVMAGSGETIDHLVWTVQNTLALLPETAAVYVPYKARFTAQPGDAIAFTLPEAGTYDLALDVIYRNRPDVAGRRFWREAWTVAGSGSPTVEIRSDYGQGSAPVGPFDITFTARVDGIELTDSSSFASISWDFGDTYGRTIWQPTHTYAAVSSVTSYTVSVTVTGYDGETYTATQTASVTLYPAPEAPDSPAD